MADMERFNIVPVLAGSDAYGFWIGDSRRAIYGWSNANSTSSQTHRRVHWVRTRKEAETLLSEHVQHPHVHDVMAG